MSSSWPWPPPCLITLVAASVTARARSCPRSWSRPTRRAAHATSRRSSCRWPAAKVRRTNVTGCSSLFRLMTTSPRTGRPSCGVPRPGRIEPGDLHASRIGEPASSPIRDASAVGHLPFDLMTVTLSGADGDLARLRRLGDGNPQGQHAGVVAGYQLAGVERVTEQELPGEDPGRAFVDGHFRAVGPRETTL